MATASFDRVRITGLCTVVPSHEVSIDAETAFYDSPKQIARMKQVVGINTRRVAAKGTTAADLSEAAARKLMTDMQLKAGEIDALIFVVQLPDYLAPATGFVLHQKLGLTDQCAVFDVNHGCAGYTYGLWIAGSLIQAGSCKRVLLLAGDQPTGGPEKGESRLLFGDAGSATVLEYCPAAAPLHFVLGSDGAGHQAIIVREGLARHPFNLKSVAAYADRDGDINFRTDMDGLKVFNFTLERVPPSIEEALRLAGKDKNEIDCFVLHQANKYILESIAEQLGVPNEKIPSSTLSKYGNLSTASVPAVICDRLREQVASGKQTLVLSGFGIGLAWATCVLELEKIYCPGMVDYQGDQLPNG